MFIGLPYIRSKMPNISRLCQELQMHYRTKSSEHIGNCADYTKLRKAVPVRGHTSVNRIVNQVATCTHQWFITEDRYTCRWKHLNFVSSHWNFLRHFQYPVNWHSFSWSWRAKCTQLITEEWPRTLKNQCSTFKVPNFHSPFQTNSLEIIELL